MSAVEPSGPAQPPKAEAYEEAANPASRNPAENAAASHSDAYQPRETRKPSDLGENMPQEGMPTSLGRGERGGGPVDAKEASATYSESRQGAQNENVDAEQMATLAEGDVADAVERKSGTQRAPGQDNVQFDDFASDLDR